jgi:hypothetical protein
MITLKDNSLLMRLNIKSREGGLNDIRLPQSRPKQGLGAGVLLEQWWPEVQCAG